MENLKTVLLIEAGQPQSSNVFLDQITKVKAAATALPELFEIVEATRSASTQTTPIDTALLDRPVFAYGSIQFLRDIKEPIFPGMYGMTGTDFATTSAYIPRKLFKNSDFAFTTWADINLNFMHWCGVMGANKLFIRPVSDRKPFAGQVVIAGEHQRKLNVIYSGSSVTRETICVVAAAKKVYAEFRFFIVNRELVTYTTYGGFAGVSNVDFSQEILDRAKDIATIVAAMEWQPDAAYTCDVTVDYNGQASVMELNPFSSAGVYNCDMDKLLKAIHKQVQRDFIP